MSAQDLQRLRQAAGIVQTPQAQQQPIKKESKWKSLTNNPISNFLGGAADMIAGGTGNFGAKSGELVGSGIKGLREGNVQPLSFTPQQYTGSGIRAGTEALTAALGGSGGATAISRLATGTAQGGAYSLGSGMEQQQTGKELLKTTVKGAAIGLAISGVAEGLRAINQSGVLKRRPAITTQRALGMTKDEISNDVGRLSASQAKTGEGRLATKLLNEMEPSGNLYDIKAGAEKALNDLSPQYEAIYSQEGNKQVNGLALKNTLRTWIRDNFSTAQIPAGWETRLDRIPNSLDAKTAGELKTLFGQAGFGSGSSVVPKPTSIESRMFYREVSRQLSDSIEQSIGSDAIRQLGRKWKLALNLGDLADRQIGNMESRLTGASMSAVASKLYYKIIGSRPRLFFARTLNNAVNPAIEAGSNLPPLIRTGLTKALTQSNKNSQNR